MSKQINIDIGCGNNKKEGYIGFDSVKTDQTDVIRDIEKDGIPYRDEIVDNIFCAHFLEHVNNPQTVIEEFYRVLKPGGIVEITVPHFSNNLSYHWLHKTYWNIGSLDLFDESLALFRYSAKARFKIILKNIEFCGKHDYKQTLFEKVVMFNGGRTYEKYLCNFIRAYQIRIIMEKV